MATGGTILLYLTTIWLPLTIARNAMVIIDVQNCFTPGGSLPVPDGDTVSVVINEMREKYKFDLILLSQDWHCHNHVSFASQHKGYNDLDVINLQYNKKGELCLSKNVTNDFAVNCTEVSHRLDQVLWPDHCVINTKSAKFHPSLVVKDTDVVVRKGYRCHVDSYSAFFDNGGFTQTELHQVLQNNTIDTVYVVGLAIDFCVSWTAMDAKELGYRSLVVLDATRVITKEGGEKALKEMKEKGVELVHSSELQGVDLFSSSAPGSLYRLPHVVQFVTVLATVYTMVSHLLT